jgi:hypothetical protein
VVLSQSASTGLQPLQELEKTASLQSFAHHSSAQWHVVSKLVLAWMVRQVQQVGYDQLVVVVARFPQ